MPTQLGTPQSTELLIRILSAAQYLGLLTFAGLWFFRNFLSVSAQVGAASRRIRLVLRVALGVAIVSSLALIPALALRIMGISPGHIWQPDNWTSGVLPSNLQANLLVAGALLVAGVLALSGSEEVRQRSTRWLTLLPVMAALFAPALSGHTAAADPAWVALAANTVHMAAGALWLGGLVGLAALVSARNATQATTAQTSDAQTNAAQTTTVQDATATVARFSNWALGAVVAVALSGVALGLTVLENAEVLTGSTYGRTLLFKVTIVAAVVGIAGWNRVVLVRSVRRAGSDSQAWRTLHQTLDYEALLIVCVLIVTGFLTNLDPSTHDHGLAANSELIANSEITAAAAQK